LLNFPRRDIDVDPDSRAVQLIGLGLLGNRAKSEAFVRKKGLEVGVAVSACLADIVTARVAHVISFSVLRTHE